MRFKPFRLAVAAAAFVALSGCATPQGEQATRAQTVLVGLPKSELLACAGVPQRSMVDGSSEYLTYVSQSLVSRPVHLGVGLGYGWGGHSRYGTGLGLSYPLFADASESRTCEATFTVTDGIVRSVSYVGDGAANQNNRQCYYIVETCLTRQGSNRG